MSWPAYFRLCPNCGGVSKSSACYADGVQERPLDNCDHCKGPLTEEDDYDTYNLPSAHTKRGEK